VRYPPICADIGSMLLKVLAVQIRAFGVRGLARQDARRARLGQLIRARARAARTALERVLTS
jgi:hypothetical protein